MQYHSTTILQCLRTALPQHSSTVLRYCSITAVAGENTRELQYSGTPILQRERIVMPQHCSAAILLNCHIPALQSYSGSVMQYYSTAILQCLQSAPAQHPTTVLEYCSITAMLSESIGELPYSSTPILQCSSMVISQHYSFAILLNPALFQPASPPALV